MASSPLACYSAPSSSSSSSYSSSSSSSSSTQVLRPCLSLLSSSNNSSLILSPKTTAQALRKTIFGTHVANSGRDVFSFCTPFLSSSSFSIRMASTSVATASSSSRSTNANPSSEGKRRGAEEKQQKLEEEEEVEEELPWIQGKALDLVEFTGSVTQAIPGPRVGRSSLPWILAVPLAYLGITFVFAFIKTVRKFNSPKEIRRKLVNKNAILCKSIDELFEQGRDGVHQSALKDLLQKTGFSMEEIFRKYIRYALNEKPFNPDSVVNLIQLRKASSLNDSQVAEIINDISRRIVKDKGPVVMDMSGYSEKGFKRKLAVQALFGKVYYLSELPEFCARDSSLIVKEIFGVADEDAEMLRLHTLSEAGDVDSLEKMVEDSDSKNTDDSSSNAP